MKLYKYLTKLLTLISLSLRSRTSRDGRDEMCVVSWPDKPLFVRLSPTTESSLHLIPKQWLPTHQSNFHHLSILDPW